MSGIDYDQLIRLVQLADRVSVNLEGSTQERLNALAPKKGFQRKLLSKVQDELVLVTCRSGSTLL